MISPPSHEGLVERMARDPHGTARLLDAICRDDTRKHFLNSFSCELCYRGLHVSHYWRYRDICQPVIDELLAEGVLEYRGDRLWRVKQ